MRIAARACVRRWVGRSGTALLPDPLWQRLAPPMHDPSDPLVVLIRTASGAMLAEATRGKWEAGAGVGIDGDGERLEDECIYLPVECAVPDGAPVTIRAVKSEAVALERVVLMGDVRSRAALRGVMKRGASLGSSLSVIDCTPLLAGTITPTTTICVVAAPPSAAPPLPSPSPSPPASPSSSSSSSSLLTLPSPASPSFLASSLHSSPLLLSSFVRPSQVPPSPAPIVLHALTQRISNPVPCPSHRDVLLEAAVSPSKLRSLQLFSGSWIRVIISTSPPQSASFSSLSPLPSAVLRIFVDRTLTTDGIYVPPSVYARFSSLSAPSTLISVHVSLLAPTDLALASALPIASRVVIARVRTPHSSAHASYVTPLRTFFSRPRPVALHELFAIEHENHPVFFRVTQLEPPQSVLLLDASQSALVVEGAVNASLPPGLLPFIVPSPPSLPSSLFTHGALPSALCSLLSPASNSSLASALSLHPSALIIAARGSGVRAAVRAACERHGLHLLDINCHNLSSAPTATSSSSSPSASALKRIFTQASDCAPCVLLLRHASVLEASALRSALSSPPSVVLAVSESLDSLSPALRALFLHEVSIPPPDEPERLEVLQQLTAHLSLANDVSLPTLASQCASLVLRDLRAVVAHAADAALKLFLRRATTSVASYNNNEELEGDAESNDAAVEELFSAAAPCVTAVQLNAALTAVQATHQGSVARIPRVTWADVGGLGDAKAELLDTVQLPLRLPHLFASGLRKRSGVLLYGPPGTGKTLLAKAVATECALNFMSVKGPELINMYVGESERNVREVFRKARAARPCVVFFDELDSLAPNRGRGADSGGVADRVVSQLLTELDGLSKAAATDVFVIGATNRPELLDPALLVPGRFDRLVYLGVPSEPSTRLSVLKALTRKFRLGPGVDLTQLATKCPTTFTGADCYALCAEALVYALARRVGALEAKLAGPTMNGIHPEGERKERDVAAERRRLLEVEGAVEVGVEDFESALTSIRPSLSRDELSRYEALHAKHRIAKP